MIEGKVLTNIGEAIALCATLGDKIAPEIARSLNRVAQGVKTDVTKTIAANSTLKPSDVKEAGDWKMRQARPADLEAEASVKGMRIGFEKFNPNPSTLMAGKVAPGGVTVDLFGKTKTISHAFMGKPYGGELQVLSRKARSLEKRKKKKPMSRESYIARQTGEKRYLRGRFPLGRFTYPGIPQIADDDFVVDKVNENAEKRFFKNFDHHIDRLLKGV